MIADIERFELFVKEILESNSRNYKIEVLKRYKDDEIVKHFLRYLFNPYVRTGISTKKLAKDLTPIDTQIDTALGLLGYVFEHNTGTDEVVAIIKGFEKKLTSQQVELLEKLICKNLQLGIDVLTINKTLGKIIPTFEIMLANKYFEKPEIVEGKRFCLTTKIDGGRIIAMKRDGEVKCFTRAGQEYEGLVDIKDELESLSFDNFVIDGEITLLDKGDLNSKEQYKKTMMITRRDGEKHGVKILAFDYMPYDVFASKGISNPYEERHKELEDKFSGLTYLNVLPILYAGEDTSQIINWLENQTSKGEEGVMINIADAPYEFKRCNSLLKVKKMHDVDLEVIGFEEGSNQNEGKLGAFIVNYKGNEVKVGTGLTKELREEIWRNKENYLGVTISVQYFEETRNQNGGISLRFPVFLDFRYDK